MNSFEESTIRAKFTAAGLLSLPIAGVAVGATVMDDARAPLVGMTLGVLTIYATLAAGERGKYRNSAKVVAGGCSAALAASTAVGCAAYAAAEPLGKFMQTNSMLTGTAVTGLGLLFGSLWFMTRNDGALGKRFNAWLDKIDAPKMEQP